MSDKAKRIFWTPEEIKKIAEEFIWTRWLDPFENSSSILTKAMASLPKDRQRSSVTSLDHAPVVQKKILELWEATINTGRNSTSVPLEAPEPTVITIEVEKPINYTDLLEQLDGPTLAALAAAKFEKVLAGLSLARSEQPKVSENGSSFRPPISILKAASPKPSRTRVAVVMPSNQFEHVREKTKDLERLLDIRYVDKDANAKRELLNVDYAILTSASDHSATETAKSALHGSRVFFTEGITRTVQKLFDISSMQRK